MPPTVALSTRDSGPLNPGPRRTRNPGANAVAAPVVGYNLVILALDAGVVRVLDLTTGLTVWEAPLEDTIIGPLAMQVAENVALLYVPLPKMACTPSTWPMAPTSGANQLRS